MRFTTGFDPPTNRLGVLGAFFVESRAMKHNLFWTAAAAALALWIGAAGSRALAQSVAEEATDTADTSASTSGAADASAADATDATQPTGVADSTADNTAASTAATGQPDAAATTEADAQAGAQADAQTPPADTAATQPAQPDASAQAGVGADASATQDAAATAQPPAAAQPGQFNGVAGAAATDIDANIQAQTGLNARTGIAAQQDLSAGLRFGQATNRGLAIDQIDRSNFLFNSGIRPGDVLVSYGGRPIRSQADFARWAVWQPGQRVPVVVLRDGRPQTLYVVYQQRQPGFIERQAGYAPSGAYLGVTFNQSVPQAAVVRSVAPGSPAEQAGIQPGDVIVGINDRQVASAQDVIQVVSTLQPGAQVDIAISRRVVLGQRPGVAQAAYAPGVRVEATTVPQPPVVTQPPTTVIQEPAPVVPAVPGVVVDDDDDVDVIRPDVDVETPRERRVERRRGVEID
jgi:membrane-associated protease RseP (regulator of RpoE activity)